MKTLLPSCAGKKGVNVGIQDNKKVSYVKLRRGLLI